MVIIIKTIVTLLIIFLFVNSDYLLLCPISVVFCSSVCTLWGAHWQTLVPQICELHVVGLIDN